MAVRVRQAVRQERAQASTSSPSQSLTTVPQFVAVLAVVLGLVAFPIAGFNQKLGSLQDVPVYAYLTLLLLELQAVYWQTRLAKSGSRGVRYLLRTLLFSVPAAVFVAILAFTPINVSPWLDNPALYIVANAVLFVLFGFDAYGRWHQRSASGAAEQAPMPMPDATGPASTGTQPSVPLGLDAAIFVAAESGGFMLTALLTAGTLLLLQSPQASLQKVLASLHLIPAQTYSLPHIPNVPLPFQLGFITQLWILDLALAIAALVIGAFAGIFVIISYPHSTGVVGQLGAIAREAAVQLRLSLGAGSFFLWLVASFALVTMADQITGFLSDAAKTTSTDLGSLGDLFNPFNPLTTELLGVLALSIVLGAIAILLVTVAAIFTEQSIPFTQGVFQTFGLAGEKLALLSPIVVYGLAGINALAILVRGSGVSEPFQIGAAQLIMIPAFVVAIVASRLRRRA
ncbi:MAG TPA: hypothetical protein VF120_15535 [Ktedonobacterales bacterium]